MFSAPAAATFRDVEDYWSEQWMKACDLVASTGSAGKWVADNILRRLTIQAPVILLFVFICLVIFMFTSSFGGQRILGVHDDWNLAGRGILQLTSLITHIFAHSDVNHIRGNVTHLLLVGPSVEHEFGSVNLIGIILVVAVASAFVHIFGAGAERTHQLGASGVVFACILLNSLVSADNGTIPMSFILISALYLGEELMLFFNFWNPDGVSHHAHLSGGLIGAAAGFMIHRQRRQEKAKKLASKWLKATKAKKGK